MTTKYLIRKTPIVFSVMWDPENIVIEGFAWRVVDPITEKAVSNPYATEERAAKELERLDSKS